MAWKIGSITSKLKSDSITSANSICNNANDKSDSNSDSDNKEADDIIKTKSSNLNGILNSIVNSKGYRNVNYYPYYKNKIHPNPSIINDLAYDTSSFAISEVGNTKEKFAVAKKKGKEEEKVTCCPLLPLVPKKRNHEIAIVACGCFWNPQQRIQKVKEYEFDVGLFLWPFVHCFVNCNCNGNITQYFFVVFSNFQNSSRSWAFHV